jgi:hypothetical protein
MGFGDLLNDESKIHTRHMGAWKPIDVTGSGGLSPDPRPGMYDPPGQLYRMDTDIRERSNVYREQPGVEHELRELLVFWRSAPGHR